MQWLQKVLAQNLAWMCWWKIGHCSDLSIIVDDLDVVGVAATPTEADAPLVIDSDAVLPFPILGQSLQPVTWEKRWAVRERV